MILQTWWLACLIQLVCGQSNYDDQANSIEYVGDGLPDSTVLDGKVTKLDDIAPIIFLNRTKAALNCAAGFMQIDLKFENPFYGIVYANFDRSSACSITGNGTRTAKIDLPLKGCGTRQGPTRVFTNNIVVRFHPGLEIDGDEVVTIVCRYPPPIAPPPAPYTGPLLPREAAPSEQPLKGFQILLIVCAILFLSLVLFGLATSYYCLRNQRVQVIRRHPVAGSKAASSLSVYDGVKIPRAHAVPSVSESEAALGIAGSDTLPSDYPSESPSTTHSEVEVDSRRRSLSSGGSYDNKAFALEESSYYEQYGHRSEEMTAIAAKRAPPEPKFNVEMRVKKAPLPPPTPSSSDTESLDRNLSTIQERDELELLERSTFLHRPQIHTPPIYTEVRKPKWSSEQKTSEYTEEMYEKTEHDEMQRSEANMEVEPVIVARKPDITSHFVDDVFLRTITEKKTIEDIERHRRQVTEYHAKQLPPPSKWDVEIRNYPNPNAPLPSGDETSTDWESHSENSSIYGIPVRRNQISMEQLRQSTLDIPIPDPPPANWESLVKVLEPEERESYREEETLTLEDKRKWRKIITTESTLRTLLTEATVREDYERIRKDQRYEKLFEPTKWDIIIRVISPQDRLYDQRAGTTSNRYRRKSEWENRSRRGSLPTLYEYDSDGSSIRTLKMDPAPAFDLRSRRTSKSSMRSDMDVRSMSEMMVDFARPDMPDNMSDRSSYYRLSRYDDDDGESMIRSVSQPSLARSASEFTESWGIRGQDWDSPDHTPRSSMRSKGEVTYSEQKSFQERRWYSGDDDDNVV